MFWTVSQDLYPIFILVLKAFSIISSFTAPTEKSRLHWYLFNTTNLFLSLAYICNRGYIGFISPFVFANEVENNYHEPSSLITDL